MKRIVLEFQFEEFPWPEAQEVGLVLTGMERIFTDMSDDEINALGEHVAQSDYWQVNQWINIQQLLGDASTSFIDVTR